MTAIGSLMFCNDCGNLLDANTSSKKITLTCDACGTTCKDTSAKVIITKSQASDFPSELRLKQSKVKFPTEDQMETTATIRQTCEKCGTEEVRYYEQQLRSADEGTTIFYSCPNCGHRWNTNN